MKIREEQKGDAQAISELLLMAFAEHPYSQQTEHLIVDALRAAQALTLSYVALDQDGKIMGYIAFSPAKINDVFTGWYTLGPLAVMLAYQRKGVGGALVEHGLAALKAMKAAGCVLVGEPQYYNRFGFYSALQLRAENIPQQYLLAHVLMGDVPQGVVTHHEAFSVGE